MAGLLFGTGGSPHSSKSPSTISGIERIAELGLDCMEIEFVQGVKMGEAKALQVREKAASLGIKLTVHAPYFINFNAVELEKIKASQERLLQTARIGSLCGAVSIAFHAAFYMDGTPEKAYVMVKKHLEEVLNRLSKENIHIWLRPEVMGRATQFGTIEEIISLCKELKRVAPCMDFAHWHARSGKANSYDEFMSVLRKFKEGLGISSIDNMHIHLSGIQYGKKGEIKHLNVNDSDLKYAELLRALKDYDAKGVVICESPSLEDDAHLLQETYHNFRR